MLNYLNYLKEKIHPKHSEKNTQEDIFLALQEEIPYVKESLVRKEINKMISSGQEITEDIKAELVQSLTAYYQKNFLLEKETIEEQMAYNMTKLQEYYEGNASVQKFLSDREPEKTYRYQMPNGKRKAGKIQLLTAGRKWKGKRVAYNEKPAQSTKNSVSSENQYDISTSDWVVDGIIFQPINGREFAIGVDGLVKKEQTYLGEINTTEKTCKFVEEHDMVAATLYGLHNTIDQENKKRDDQASHRAGAVAVHTGFYTEMKNLNLELPYPLNEKFVAIYKSIQKTNYNNNTAPLLNYVTSYLVSEKMDRLSGTKNKRRRRQKREEFEHSGARNALGEKNLVWLKRFLEALIDKEYASIGDAMFASQKIGFEDLYQKTG